MARNAVDLTDAEADLIRLIRSTPAIDFTLRMPSSNGVWTVRFADYLAEDVRETIGTTFDSAWRAARFRKE